MLRSFKERREQEEGFTLIELMVVVLIIAILLAIAIPTFLGARDRANDRAAQSSLRNALTAAKTIYTDAQSYVSADATGLLVVEPSLTYKASANDSTGFKDVSVNGASTAWFAAAQSKSGKCFYISDTGATKYYQTATNTTCNAGAGVTASASFTSNGW